MPGGDAIQTVLAPDGRGVYALIRQFILWSGKRHPKEMGGEEVRRFLGHLATERAVAPRRQNQALNALGIIAVSSELSALGWE